MFEIAGFDKTASVICMRVAKKLDITCIPTRVYDCNDASVLKRAVCMLSRLYLARLRAVETMFLRHTAVLLDASPLLPYATLSTLSRDEALDKDEAYVARVLRSHAEYMVERFLPGLTARPYTFLLTTSGDPKLAKEALAYARNQVTGSIIHVENEDDIAAKIREIMREGEDDNREP